MAASAARARFALACAALCAGLAAGNGGGGNGNATEASASAPAGALGKAALRGAARTGNATSAVEALASEGSGTMPRQGAMGWQATPQVVGGGSWCRAEVPSEQWMLSSCWGNQVQVKVLTYNLFWWNLFGRQQSQGRTAGQLIAATSQQPYDIMAFQECEDVNRVLRDAGLADRYAALQGMYALGLAYRTSEWQLVGSGAQDVAEDGAQQWFGLRAGQWVRLQHRSTGRLVFFMNHHGPLPLGTGGRCGGDATAFNLLKVVATSARDGDAVLLVGDFNANAGSSTVQQLQRRLHKALSGSALGSIDHLFTSCGPNSVVATSNLGSGGSDHDALTATFQI